MKTAQIAVLLIITAWCVRAQSIEITPTGNLSVISSKSTNYFDLRKTGTNTYAGIRFLQVNSLRGGIFYTDANSTINIGNLTSQPGVVWRTSDQRAGIGTFQPEGKLHIHANSTGSFPHLLLKENNTTDGARINFENFQVEEKRWTLYGKNELSDNSVFNIFHSDYGNVTQFYADGKVLMRGFTQLGPNAPAVQMRKFTGNLPDANSHDFTLPADIAYDKIIDYTIFVNVQDPKIVPVGSTDYRRYKYFPHDNNPTGCNYRAVIFQDFSSGQSNPRARVSFSNIGSKVKTEAYSVVVFYEP